MAANSIMDALGETKLASDPGTEADGVSEEGNRSPR
jgi:hypothetical protein